MSIRDSVNRELKRDDTRRKALGDIPDVPFDVDNMMRWENAELTDEAEVVAFFQSGIDSGIVWNLQGSYGRTARALIEAGYCHEADL